MKITVNKPIVTWKLGKELVAANIPHNGMSLFANELVIMLSNEAQEPQAQAVVDAHNSIDTIEQRFSAAKTTAKNIPNWTTWSQQNWATWRDANISATQVNAIGSLVDAKAILLKMSIVLDNLAKMEIALRDQVWPDIPEG